MKHRKILQTSKIIFWIILLGTFAFAQTDKDIDDLKESVIDTMLLTYEISQSPLREFTPTKDVQEEAKKYFQAWIDGDAETILAYRPPHQIKTDIETVKFTKKILKEKNADKPIKPIDLIKATLEGMGKETVKFNSVKVGEIIETGILIGENAKIKEKIFTVIKVEIDAYFRGKKDIINTTVVGYTDGTRWYFKEREGVPENMLKVLKSGTSEEIDEYFKSN